MARILYVTNARSRFIEIDRELLDRRHEVEELYCRPPWINPVAIGAAVRRADVVVGWFAAWHMVAPLAWARLLRKPSLLIVGGFDVAAMVEIGYGDQRPGVRRPIGRWVLRSATRLMTNSRYSREEAGETTGLPAERFEVVHHGVPDLFGALPEEARPRRALTVGGVVRSNLERKGHEAFVRTAALLPEVEFVLVGGWGDDAIDHLRRLATPNVRFTGRLDEAELLDAYRTASVYVQPSRHEGFGMSVAEAMLAGCVPVVTRAGALPEVVGEAGVYADSRDPADIARAIRAGLEADRGARVAARSRILETFPLERREEGLLRLVDRALEAGRESPPRAEAPS